MTKLKKEWHDEIIALRQQKKTQREIAEKYGVSINTIQRFLNKNGYYSQLEHKISPDKIREYGAQGLTIAAISEKTGVCYQTIDTLVRRHNIPVRRIKRFTQKEVDWLFEHAGEIPVKLMAKKLKCDRGTVDKKLAELGLSGRVELDNFNLRQVAELTGEHYDSIRYWTRRGYIKSKKPSNERGSHVVPKQEVLRLLKEKGKLTRELELFLG